MTTPTANPVPSTAPQDLLFNAGKLDEVANSLAPAVIDRLGRRRLTVNGAMVELNARVNHLSISINAALATIQTEAYLQLAGLGYLPPVAYQASIAITNSRQTVRYDGQSYSPIPEIIPFTTGATFDPSQWRLNQGLVAADLQANSGAGIVRFLQPWVGAKSRSLLDKVQETASIFDFMTPEQRADVMTGVNSMDLAIPFALAFMWAAEEGKPTCLEVPCYYYTASQFPPINFSDFEIRTVGTPTFKCTGTTPVLHVFGETGFIYGIRVGDCILDGNANIESCFKGERFAHARFGKIRVRNCSVSGFHIALGVLCVFDTPTVSVNRDGSMATVPLEGMHITAYQGHSTTAVLIQNPIMEGVEQGVVFAAADFVVSESGTYEACTKRGINIMPSSKGIHIRNPALEANAEEDVIDQGLGTKIEGGYSKRKIIIGADSRGASVMGVYCHNIEVDITSVGHKVKHNYFNAFPEDSDNVPGTITVPIELVTPNVGENWDVGLGKFDRTGVMRYCNPVNAMQEVALGASPAIYVNATEYREQILVRGGVILRIDFLRGVGETVIAGGGTNLPVTGLFEVLPGDSLRVTYTGVPTIIRIPL